MQRPTENEHSRYFGQYIALVEDGDAIDLMSLNRTRISRLFSSLSDEQQQFRYAPDKWTPKDVLAHIVDTERGMCYRAMCIARGDAKNLPYMDEDLYAQHAHAAERPMNSLLSEYHAVREATILLFRDSIPAERQAVIGMVNSNPMSPRALAWIVAGHEIHHVAILRDRYGLPIQAD